MPQPTRFNLRDCGGTALLREVLANRERLYVAEQRQFISEPFETAALDRIPDIADLPDKEPLRAYAAAVRAFNVAFEDHRAFRETYLSAAGRKTLENARVLEAKGEVLEERLKDVTGTIVSAQEVLEKNV